MMDSTSSQSNGHAESGTVSKRKKDHENKNSGINSDFAIEWKQKGEKVILTILTGSSSDNANASVVCESKSLRVTLMDGRSFFSELYQPVCEEEVTIRHWNHRCIIELTKKDPSIQWTSFHPSKAVKEKSCSPLRKDDNVEKSQVNLQSASDESCEVDAISISNIKTDMVERDQECFLTVYLYVKSVSKDDLNINFNKNTIDVTFSTSDPKILSESSSYTKDSVFSWHTKLKDAIEPESCSYKVTNASIEMKLKKVSERKWGCLAPLSLGEKVTSPQIIKNKWMTPGTSSIPPAPPVPPTPSETKKPTCLVSPVSKGTRVGTSASFSPVSPDTPSDNRGMTGLENIGNTCFMNSVLQCLINTVEFRDYFLETNFQQDLNKDNPLGMGGKLAISFAVLMKLVWQGTHRSHAPIKVKSMMSLKANQFSGFAQHDAQEFMVELLDGLHEDLNRIKKKPYIAEPPDLDGWPEEEAANESWKLHKMRNDSIIDDLFKGQFKSTLTCHQCGKISVKFDEFGCLSVPIPKDQKVIQVIFFWKDTTIKPKKYFIKVNADAVVEDLKYQLSGHTNVTPACMQIIEVFNSKIYKIFSKGESLSPVVFNDILMSFEVYNELQIGEPVLEIAVIQRLLIPNPPKKCTYCSRTSNQKLRRCTKCFRASYCDTNCQKSHWSSHKSTCKLSPEPVGLPFIISMPESHATYHNITMKMEAYSRHSVDIFQPPVSQRTESTNHRGSTSSCEMSNDEMEVDSEGSGDGARMEGAVAEGGSSNSDDEICGPQYWVTDGNGDTATGGATGSLEGGGESSNSSSGEDLPLLSSSPNVRAVQPRPELQLAPGRQLFTIKPVNSRAQNFSNSNDDTLCDKGDEPLNLGDKYYIAMDWKTNERLPVHCIVQTKEPDCEVVGSSSVQRNKETTLDACIQLFTQPENLSEDDSWRCPRCKKPVEATKQMSVWRLPTVLIIQLKRFSFKYVLYSDKIDKFVQYPLRGLDMSKYMSHEPQDGPALYDLYGVINHMGRLLGGHYTAFARTVSAEDSRKNEIDWRFFDDSRVNFLSSENRVVNEQAYLLMYRRRDIIFKVPRPPVAAPAQEACNQEQLGDSDVGEITPMSISSTSQPSTSSVEVEELPATVQEELD